VVHAVIAPGFLQLRASPIRSTADAAFDRIAF
jgi:hypothetical protein